MMRIAALNDSSCESSNDEDVGPTQEILEAHATRFYRKAISHLAKEELSEAKEAIFEILKNPYIEKAGWKDEAERPKALPQDIALKYSCFKNLGNIHMSEKKYEEASKFYLKAVYLDSTEVTLWQKLGASAIKIKDFQLAIIAFQEGLLINPNHWPCLDQLLSVLFILGLYEDCLCIAITSLQRDPYYVKALAFKDYIFETQPNLKSFAREYFKESDILFGSVSYDKAMGDKFINTCLSLRPHQKSFHSPSPIKLPNLAKNIKNFNWIELIDIFKSTYDQLILDEPKMFVTKLEFRSFIKDLLDIKMRESIKDNLRNNLNSFFKPGRRLCRSLSVNDDSILKQKFDNETSIIEGLPENLKTGLKTVISKRRQTIELGESQESFRINNRRNSAIDSKIQSIVEVETDKLFSSEKTVISGPKAEGSEISKICSDDSHKEVSAIEETKTELNKEKTEYIGDASVIEGTTMKSSKDVINDLAADNSETDMITEQVQSAADQLKDIMEVKTSTKILNLNHSQLGMDEDFYEYFDGGVYEEEDDDDDDDEGEDDDDDEMECDDVAGNLHDDNVDKNVADIQIVSELNNTSSKNKVEGKNEDKNANCDNTEKKVVEEAQIVKGDSEVTSLHSHSTVADKERSTKEIKESSDVTKETANVLPSQTAAPKKPKRAKRGLERELEQLDYWGRRKAREAKRRRRTLTSKLVGDFEQNEYLTWAHLIRSFIPAALLSQEECSILKEVRDKLNEKNAKESLDGEKSLKDNGNQKSVNVEIDSTERNEEPVDKMVKNSNITFLEHFGGSFDISLWNPEELEVGEFLHSCENNGGILDVLQRCQKDLIKIFDRVWPLKCALGYIDLHQRIRKHITVGATLNLKEDPQRLFTFAHTTLIYIELLLSLNRLPSNKSFNRDELSYNLEQIINDENNWLEEDLFDVQLLLGRPDVWKEKYFEAHLRVAWVQSQIKIIHGFPEEGIFHLEVLLEQMLLGQREEEAPLFVKSSKIDGDDLILSTSHIQKELNILQRSQLLENIEAKFKAGFYEEVVHILTSYFGDSNTKVGSGDLCLPRYVQLMILVESLVNIKDVKRTIQWGSLCLNESVDNFHSNDVDEDERKKWTETIRDILLLLLELVIEEPKLVSETSHEELIKMVASLVNVLVIQLELGSNLPEPYFSTLSPWIVLHTILSQYEEAQEKRKASEKAVVELDEKSNDEREENEKGSSAMPSTLLLITAHDELGKNEWCCIEEGKFLLYMMDVLMEELEKPLSDEQKLSLQQAMEQIMFCLFLHPSRKTKYRHLRDHNGHSIPLTWTRALQLFKFYLPQQLPEFQSDQFPSISDDVSALFRRILSLLPEEYKHEDQTKLVEDYIDRQIGSDKLIPMRFPKELRDCYYLLADNYFKGKEWEQAIQYYKLDVSINVNRIDSWSPMGLAKKAQLETLLNSCEIIRNTEEFFKDAQRASRCLDRGLQLDPYFCNIWVEKGGLVYMIHSHASRLLKQDLNPDMSIEMFESLEKIKGDMLSEALKCFSNASKIVEEGWDDEDLPDERWLYQYMLGKLAEKTNKGPEVVFFHYLDALRRLHNMGAKYPAKISYCNPVEYSVEVLEVYFRIHVYIFKYLHQREGKDIEPSVIKMFKIVIEKLSQSPFVLCQEKEIHKSTTVLVSEIASNTLANKGPNNDIEEPPSKKLKNDENIDIDDLLGEDLNNLLNSLKNESSRGGAETNSGNAEKSEESPKKGVDDKERINLVLKCIEAFELCVKRFPHHYKSLYRLAYFYHTSKTHKDNYKARNILLGCDLSQSLSYMPSSGLFVERKISTMNPKNSNLFNGVWRIPHDEIDRPGSFAAHMYRCVSLCLDILHETKDFYAFLEIAIALRHSPDKDKKYLRDNERELLFEHATQVGIQTMKDKYRQLFKSSVPLQNSKCHSFIVDVYRAYKQMSRFLSTSDSPFSKMLVESFSSFKGLTNDNSANLLREAEKYCVGYPSTSVITSINPNVHSQNGIRNGVPPTPSMHNFVRRGRPPGPSRDFNTARFRAPQENKSIAATNPCPTTSGQSVAVQQAYKVYENLIQAQTILHNKNLDEKSLQYYKGKYEEYKQQMLKYLQISSVSQFFHSSLQSLGTSASKLPPPPPISQPTVTSQNKSIPSTTTTTITANKVSTFSHNKHSLDSLAEKSKAHGISISAVSKKVEPVISKPVKPSMSITLSQSSKTCSNVSGSKISLVNLNDKNSKVDVSRNTTVAATTTTTTTTTPVTTTAKATTATITTTATTTANSTLPKLPPGTTLSRQLEQQTSGVQKFSHNKEQDKLKTKSLSSLSSALSSKGSVTITHAKPSDISTTKKHSSTSFQAVFQASIAKPKVDISPVNTKDSSSLPATKNLQQGIKLSSLKHFKTDDKRWESISQVLSSNKTTGELVSTSTININTVTASVNTTSTATVTTAIKSTTLTSQVQSNSKSGETCQVKSSSKPTNADKTKDPCIITID